MRKKHLRIDDYRFYGRLCLIFGIILLIIGVALPILTIKRYVYLFTGNTAYYEAPYLGTGIALVVIGIILIVVSQILYREYRIRIEENKAKMTAVLPPQPS